MAVETLVPGHTSPSNAASIFLGHSNAHDRHSAATAGGTSGNKGAGGGTVTASGSGWAAGLSATGGTGDQFGSTRNGQSPGTHTYNGQSYNGGAVQSTAQAAGNSPGGGGNGGTGNAFNGNQGGAGAPGGAWCRAYQ